MSDSDPGVSPLGKKETLALSLARGLNQAEAAKAAGCSVKTVQRRLKDPEFVALVESCRSRLLGRAVDLLGALAAPAALVAGQLLKNKDPRVQLGAVKAILASVVRVGEYHSLSERVAEIERALQEKGRRR